MPRSRLAVLALGACLIIGAQPPLSSQEEQKQKPAEPATQRTDTTPGQPVNVKVDLTISDQVGSGEPLRKTVSMVVADRGSGSIRSLGSIKGQGRVQINVDAQPQILQSGAIRMTLRLEYNPRSLGNDADTEWSSLHEQFLTMLEPGKPLVVSQAADPASDRKILVEVRATLMK